MSRNTSNIRRCRICEREFDLRQGGRVDAGIGGPVCPECLRRQGVQRRARISVRPGMGGTIAKCAAGLVFVLTAFTMEDAGTLGVGLVMGLALIVWGVWPWLRLKAEQSRSAREKAAADERWREELRAAEEREKNRRRVCPSCGAPTKGKVCEYCGSPLDE